MGERPLEPHHAAWLAAHAHRSEAWLRERLAEGFDVHHIDGNHANDAPANLCLIEHTDHMRLHGGWMLGRLRKGGGPTGGRTRIPSPALCAVVYRAREAGSPWSEVEEAFELTRREAKAAHHAHALRLAKRATDHESRLLRALQGRKR